MIKSTKFHDAAESLVIVLLDAELMVSHKPAHLDFDRGLQRIRWFSATYRSVRVLSVHIFVYPYVLLPISSS